MVGAQELAPTATELSLADWWIRVRKRISKESRKMFDTFIALVTWSIWLERNNRTFNRQARSTLQLQRHIQEQASEWTRARFTAMAPFATHNQQAGIQVQRQDGQQRHQQQQQGAQVNIGGEIVYL
ncbi:hypothetical protein HU200_017588 [Digitaria exilis]|uniref:Uncharacterized protein n=1 Tax=Digitaria exilis TaxID=1010633 RepID=A0A835F685_9POAL|nr:hypothetical protein HU200_017588 [Digitaria exilis]